MLLDYTRAREGSLQTLTANNLTKFKGFADLRRFEGAMVYNHCIMRDVIFQFIMWVARVHDSIIGINDNGQYNMTDKQLHFWVVGLFGMALIVLIQPVFKGLAENGHTLVVTWIYVFTVVLVITFAVEIGQWYSGTGVMDSSDIAYGVTGFLVLFFIYAMIRTTILTIYRMIKSSRRDDRYEIFEPEE